MRLTLIRLLIIAVLFLLFEYVLHWTGGIVLAFVAEYILEPLVTSKI